MRRLRRTILFAHAWLAVAMTLVAGVPHFTCRCPDGQVKPFCLSLAENLSSCCDRACCSHDEPAPVATIAASEEAPCTCCQQPVESQGLEPGTSQEVRPASCDRELAPAQVLALTEIRASSEKEGSVVSLLPPGASPLLVAPLGVGGTTVPLSSHALAPPTDLITSLQRLLI